MELVAVVFSALAFMLASGALALSVWNTIHIQAQRLSTHTVIPVQPETTTFSDLEEQLEKIGKVAGADQADMNHNLYQQGLDPDDMV